MEWSVLYDKKNIYIHNIVMWIGECINHSSSVKKLIVDNIW